MWSQGLPNICYHIQLQKCYLGCCTCGRSDHFGWFGLILADFGRNITQQHVETTSFYAELIIGVQDSSNIHMMQCIWLPKVEMSISELPVMEWAQRWFGVTKILLEPLRMFHFHRASRSTPNMVTGHWRSQTNWNTCLLKDSSRALIKLV